MKIYNYSSIIGIIAFFVLAAGCQDNQLLNTGDSMVAGVDEIQVTNTDPSLEITAPIQGDIFEFDPVLGILNIDIKVLGTRNAGTGANTNVCGFRDFELSVVPEGGVSTVIAVGTGGQDRFEENSCLTSLEKTFVWVINNEDQLGTYKINAKAVYGQGSDEQAANDEVEDVEIELTATGDNDIIVDYPAAPSVASSLLKDSGIQARWGQGRSGGNYISEVAQHMGQRATFNGVEKNDWQDYRCEVADFLNDRFAETGESGTVDCTVD